MDAKRSRAADVWRERVIAQQGSGQSVRAWCRQHRCPEHGFCWWPAKLVLSPRSAVKRRRREAGSIAFAEVVVVVERPAPEPLVLRLGRGRELLFPPALPMTRLAELLRAVEGAAS
jgi:hypothetical protein